MPVDVPPPAPGAAPIPHVRKLAFGLGALAMMLVIAAVKTVFR